MANEQNLKPWPKGVSGNPKGKPKGRKSLSTMVRDFLEQEVDWKQVPLKNTEEFREMYGDKPLAAEVLIRGAFAEAMGKGGTQAREWLRKSGYGDKIDVTSDEKPIPILGVLPVNTNDVPNNYSTDQDSGTGQADQGDSGGDVSGQDDSDSDAPDSGSPDKE